MRTSSVGQNLRRLRGGLIAGAVGASGGLAAAWGSEASPFGGGALASGVVISLSGAIETFYLVRVAAAMGNTHRPRVQECTNRIIACSVGLSIWPC